MRKFNIIVKGNSKDENIGNLVYSNFGPSHERA